MAPVFRTGTDAQGSFLSIAGNGNPEAVGYISKKVSVGRSGTYSFSVLFSFSEDVNPQRNLLFQCIGATHDGIFDFYRLPDGMVEGRAKIVIPEGTTEAKLRIFYRFNGGGEARIRSLSLVPTDPVEPRWVKFACISGRPDFGKAAEIIDKCAAEGVDLLLLPEHCCQEGGNAAFADSIFSLYSSRAARHGMYISGAVTHIEPDGRKFNKGVLFDRSGNLTGVYDKIHPYSPEVNDDGVTPGRRTDIFHTDFGKVGIIICYDSWFTDVTELLARKGAEVILLPNAGYYKSLLHARAADNGVRFVVSSLYDPAAIFDTAGRDIEDPLRDPTVRSLDGTFRDIQVFECDGIRLLISSLDLNRSPSPHYNGGTMVEAPGGKRNRADQLIYLDDMIKREKERWWVE